MKLGIISYSFEDEEFRRIKGLGLDCVEFCVNYDNNDRHAEFSNRAVEIRKNLEALGLETASVGRWGGNKLFPDGRENPAELAADKMLIAAAAKAGSPVYVTGCNYAEKISLYENYSAAIGYFEKLLAEGKEQGVKIATYNCRWNNFVHSDPAWSVIHGYLKELTIKFDPSHCVYDGGNYLSEMKKWGSRFAHVHIKGSVMIDGERFDDPPAGLDQTNWGVFMEMLYAAGYDGNLSIEPHSPIWKDGPLGDWGVKHTVQVIRDLML